MVLIMLHTGQGEGEAEFTENFPKYVDFFFFLSAIAFHY